MRILNFLRTGVPFVLLSLSADAGGAGGGTAAETLPEPVGGTLEEKLTSAKGFIGSLFARVTQLTKDLATAAAENVRVQGQFDAANSTATGLTTTLATVRGELATAQATIGTLTAERDGAKNELATAQGNITRLEKLCGLNGIDPKAAITVDDSKPAGTQTAEDFNVRLAAAKTNEEKEQILAEFEKAVAAGTVKKTPAPSRV